MILSNDILEVTCREQPIPTSYLHKPSGIIFGGAPAGGVLAVNGKRIPWRSWDIYTLLQDEQIVYEMTLPEMGLSLKITITLAGSQVLYSITDISSKEKLTHIDWLGLPLITCKDSTFSYYREKCPQTPWDAPQGKGLYWEMEDARGITDTVPDRAPEPTVHACLHNGEVCCFLKSSQAFLPLSLQLTESKDELNRSGGAELGLNRYYYLDTDGARELSIQIVFLEDINGDGRADECDYQLWMNRSFPRGDSLYKEAIWYKICCDSGCNPRTTFDQALEIIRRIHNVTDGKKQVVYLVGWQYHGHDTGYPAFDRVNQDVGGPEALTRLKKEARRYNAIVSYHTNVDDAYEEESAWDSDIICRSPKGKLMDWEVFNDRVAYHICHAKDVASGKVFKRIDDMMAIAPVERTIHLDAFRNTNCSWEDDRFISPVEELECGVWPIIDYFQDEYGIDVTTESLNGTASEIAGRYSAIWQFRNSLMYHGVVMGGGTQANVENMARGVSLCTDLNIDMVERDWDQIVAFIFQGIMLYHYSLSTEMLELRCPPARTRWATEPGETYIRYADGTEAWADTRDDSLRITRGKLVIADGQDRCIPTEDGYWLYSRDGGTMEVPIELGQTVARVYTTTMNGKGESPDWMIKKTALTVYVPPRMPVRIRLS